VDFAEDKRKKPDKDTRVIAVINQKGGVGKSTTVINLAASLGEMGYKCLAVDFDPQGNTTSGLGIEKNELEACVYNAITEDLPMRSLVMPTVATHVYLVPATMQLAGAEIELVSVMARENVLKDALSDVVSEFDFVFIDCPPSLGLLTINALVAADSLLIPIQCEYYALEGVSKLIESMRMVKRRLNPTLSIFGVLLTMYDTRTTLSRQVAEEVRNYFGKDVFKTVIPRSVKVSEAPSHGEPVTMYAHMNKGSIAYRNLAKEVVKRA
jgi:chromosome partitioning protein